MDEDRKTPSKPKPTTATYAQLEAHYNSQVPAYNLAVTGKGDPMEPLDPLGPTTKDELIELIRKQNHRLGRHIKARSHELLLTKATDEDGALKLRDGKYTVGLTYSDILDILAVEFPEASTSVACLRWYVVHMKSDAEDEGLPWPDLPQFRPRSATARSAAASQEVQS